MSVVYGSSNFGLYSNSHLQYKTNYNFTSNLVELYDGSEAYSNGYSIKAKNNTYGSTFNSDEFVPIDVSKNYQASVMMRTITPNYLGNPGSGYFGFTCYDEDKLYINHEFVSVRSGTQTTLSRDLNPGDSYVYITDSSNWYTPFSSVNSRFVIYPPTHPKYSTAYYYSRYNYIYSGQIDVMVEGDFRLTITNTNGTPITFPSIGYSTPAGTPIANNYAGAGHNYCLGGNIDVSNEWTLYKTSVFTGEGGLGGLPFRNATKYVRFLALLNYKYRLENAGVSAEFLMDNFMLVEIPPNRNYPDKMFTRTLTS